MDSNINASQIVKYIKLIIPIVAIGIVLTIVSLALTITTLVRVNKGFDDRQTDGDTSTTSSITTTTTTPSPPPTTTTTGNNVPSTTTVTYVPSTTVVTNVPSTTPQPPPNSTLSTVVRIEEVMSHLNELQRIATTENGTRAVNTPGFNRTLDYISNYLAANTNYNVIKSFFPVRQFILASNPILISSVNGNITNYTYSNNLSYAEFYHVQYSTSFNFPDYVELTAIPNEGCLDDDWQNASLPVAGRVALVKRGICSFAEKAALASKYNVAALLLYNDGVSSDRIQPILTNLGQTNAIPALFLSYTVGQALADAALDPTLNAGVIINIVLSNEQPFPVGNICADTPTGDVTQTIVIGSHSDSVPAGPGINDNGSGSAANLGLAVALARLFQTSTYAKYKYRVRFCWWGAEEIGLLGSDDHVKKAKNSTVVGERLTDYLINLNYDMLGSPNFMFGIYDGKTARNDTPPQALPGSNKMTDLFKNWFIGHNLPWDYTDFSGRSDYGPFLAEGIVAGGLFTGADETKTQDQRDRYNEILGQGMGGIAGVIHDPCYHRACDSIGNINVFAYDKMVQAAAYVLEFLARQDDLKVWLYPNSTIPRHDAQRQHREYNSINEFFQLPYL